MLLGIEQRGKLDAIDDPHQGKLGIPHRDELGLGQGDKLDLGQGEKLADHDEFRQAQGFRSSSEGCRRGGHQLLRGVQGAADRDRGQGREHR